ncbi:MAG: hypothetical protein FVQ82_14745 [Planctomycetes bacterium]|nr:hypothetical protein [Planctomycetota bacterium]
MATVNKRTSIPQAVVINGVDAGGDMTVRITAGFDQKNQSAPDGLEVPVKDKEIQYVRGSVTTQDWIHAVELLTGALGTLVFYERKSGVAAATGYIKHTIVNPVIHKMRLSISKKRYAEVSFGFECRAADETAGITDMHTTEDTQAAPSYISAARGGVRIISATHGTGGTLLSILHSTAFEFSIALPLVKESNDADVGYTCVDARLDGLGCEGKTSFQDGGVKAVTTQLLIQQLIIAAAGPLVLTVRQSQAATNKLITIANVDFDNVYSDSDVNSEFTGYSADFDIANVAGTPVTLDGANKIITIADVA